MGFSLNSLFQTGPKIPYPISDQTLTPFYLLKQLRTFNQVSKDNQIAPLRDADADQSPLTP